MNFIKSFQNNLLKINNKKNKKKIEKKPKNWKTIILGDTITKKFFRIYFLAIFIGTCFLYMPFVLNPGWVYENNHYVWHDLVDPNKIIQKYSFFDAIFLASSAFSDTGLVTLTVANVYNIGGQIILALLIQLGGLGLLVTIVLLWRFLTFKSKFSFDQNMLIHFERGDAKIGNSYKIIYSGFTAVLLSELIGWIFLSLFFYYQPASVPINAHYLTPFPYHHLSATDYYHNAGLAIWAGFFHVVSAANNSGFDILGANSLEPFRNDGGNILSVIMLFEFIMGGIGYPVFYDIYMKIKAKRKNTIYYVSLFTKLSVVCYLFFACFGLIFISIFEFIPRDKVTLIMSDHNTTLDTAKTAIYGWGHNTTANKVWNILFISLSSRSAGFATLNMNQLTNESKWLISFLMFIGASPASTGGGIRAVTLWIIILRIFYTALGRKYLFVFKRTIHRKLINQCFINFFIALGCIAVCVFIISLSSNSSDPNFSLSNLMFEASSAFGTSGLTVGVVNEISIVGKICLIFLMFIGQLGVGTTLTSWTKKKPHMANARYKYEDLKIS